MATNAPYWLVTGFQEEEVEEPEAEGGDGLAGAMEDGEEDRQQERWPPIRPGRRVSWRKPMSMNFSAGGRRRRVKASMVEAFVMREGCRWSQGDHRITH